MYYDVVYPQQPQQPAVLQQGYAPPPTESYPVQHPPPEASYYPAQQMPNQSADSASAPPDYSAGNNLIVIIITTTILLKSKDVLCSVVSVPFLHYLCLTFYVICGQ